MFSPSFFCFPFASHSSIAPFSSVTTPEVCDSPYQAAHSLSYPRSLRFSIPALGWSQNESLILHECVIGSRPANRNKNHKGLYTLILDYSGIICHTILMLTCVICVQELPGLNFDQRTRCPDFFLVFLGLWGEY
jgi:hypothetical protein